MYGTDSHGRSVWFGNVRHSVDFDWKDPTQGRRLRGHCARQSPLRVAVSGGGGDPGLRNVSVSPFPTTRLRPIKSSDAYVSSVPVYPPVDVPGSYVRVRTVLKKSRPFLEPLVNQGVIGLD